MKIDFREETVYNSKNLTKEKQAGIINGLKDWLNTGNFTDKGFDREFYSPSKDEYLRHLSEEQTPIQKMTLSTKTIN